MIATVRDGQCLLDVALMVTCATEGVWALAIRNGISVTADLECGARLEWEYEDVEDEHTVARYVSAGVCPATEVSEGVLSELLREPPLKRVPAYEAIEADEVEPQSTRASIFGKAFTAAFA